MIPKFRAWHKELKMMLDVTALNFKQKLLFYDREIFEIVSGEYIGTSGEVESFDKFVIMQSTGLFDKNGVEIFEGDMVDAYDYYENLGRKYKTTRFTGVITYEENSFYLKDGEGFFNNRWVNAEEIEIIGNVWEDGDLIDCKDAEVD